MLNDEVSDPDDQRRSDDRSAHRLRPRATKRSNTHLLMGQTLYRTEMHDKSRKPEEKEGYWSETTISSNHSNRGRQADD
jgi:hypothetical protein